MSLILISIILSVSPYYCGSYSQDTTLKKDDLKVVLYSGLPPEALASLPEKTREEYGPEKPLLVTKVAADGKFKAEASGAMVEGQITRIDSDKIEVIVQHATLVSTDTSDIKTTVKLNEPIEPAYYGFSSIIHLFYFRVINSTEEIEIKSLEDILPNDQRPRIKIRQN